MNSKTKGIHGENRASEYLEHAGFEILERNYQEGKAEIDLITLFNNILLVFVEVKVRKGDAYGEPESFVSEGQQRRIIRLADDYVHAINWTGDIRFDIISINAKGEVYHIEDAFY